jgi:cytochrome c oxidase subunit 2
MFRKPLLFLITILALAAIACGASGGGGSSNSSKVSGEQIFEEKGCNGCHSNSSVAPSLSGLFGGDVSLQNGETVTADEAYIHESILDPKAKVVQGYQPIMPEFKDQLSDEELQALVEYVKNLE